MRDTIASGIGSLLLVMASHVRRCTTSWADAPFHFTRLPAGSRTDSGGEPIMQHYGAPTRLLDFTYSVYVAAYFAVEEAEDDCVVWAVDGPWVLQPSGALLRSGGKTGTSKMLKPFIDDDEQVIQPLF